MKEHRARTEALDEIVAAAKRVADEHGRTIHCVYLDSYTYEWLRPAFRTVGDGSGHHRGHRGIKMYHYLGTIDTLPSSDQVDVYLKPDLPYRDKPHRVPRRPPIDAARIAPVYAYDPDIGF